MKIQISIYLVASLILCGSSYAAGIQKSTLEDQVGIEVTVYNNNLGLIKDIRTISLRKGKGELRFMDVASFIMPDTVHVKCLNRTHKSRLMSA